MIPEWEQRSYCFMGKPGTMKTLTLSTFRPLDWKEDGSPWAYIFACDRKKHGGLSVLMPDKIKGIDYDIYVSSDVKKVTSVSRAAKMQEPKILNKWIEKYEELDRLAEEGSFPYSMVALDTATGFQDLIWDEIFYARRVLDPKASPERKGRSTPAMDEYGDAQWYFISYIKALTQLPCITIVVCHTKMQEDSDGRLRYLPNLPGRAIIDEFLAMFDEVYYFEQKPGASAVEVRTTGTLSVPARTSLGFMPSVVKPDYKEWRKVMSRHFTTQP